ncbi:aspartate/glutamate racemase family protein [Methylobacterium marchantiae]|uniref:Aspartate/glutamate racemase family protein n=1 Tax=Methylobacterium marchantiae TaxID=600331 RepID=A0ABW3X0M4_9HYPH|nr:Aspartate racemase [Methylobacterium marchantiae]
MLGILGGMGPMATVDFLRRLVELTPALRDQDHLPCIVAQATGIPDRTRAILGEGSDPLPALEAALRQLEGAGATCIAMPCNTAHHWHGALQARTTRPILHIVDAVADTLMRSRAGDAPVGLLASTGTVQAGLYVERLARRGIACRVPEDQEAVMRAIRLVKAGALAEAGILLSASARSLLASGCGQVVLACTEIPIALRESDPELRLRLVDATEALAEACLRACSRPLAAARLAA